MKIIANKKGFTIVELIVVIVILGIIASVAIPSMLGYLKKAEQTRLDQSARTIFNAAQNAMTSNYNRGYKGEMINGDGKVDVTKITPAYQSPTVKNDQIRYLHFDVNDPNRFDSKLYRLIEDRVGDQTLFDASIIVEYNYVNGKVLSVFFAGNSRAKSLGYGGTGFNAYIRDKKTRREAPVGFWDVGSVGGVLPDEGSGQGGPIVSKEADIQFVDYGARYLDDAGRETDYDKGHGINGGKNYGLLTVEVRLPVDFDPNKINGNPINVTVGGVKIASIDNRNAFDALPRSLDQLVQSMGQNNGENNNVYIDKVNGQYIMVAVIDGPLINSQTWLGRMNVGQPNGANPSINAQVTGVTNQTLTSKFVKPYFSGGSYQSGKLQVSSIRHMKYLGENINGVKAIDNYTGIIDQTKNISYRNYDEKLLKNFASSMNLKGTYRGNGFAINDLTVTAERGKVNSGLFGQIDKSGSVSNLAIDYTEPYWNQYSKATDKASYFVGGQNSGLIAGTNSGKITNCQVMGRVSGTKNAGGIVGSNQDGATVDSCYSGANITSTGKGSNAGGIAGQNSGVLNRLEVGTFMKLDTTLTPNRPKLIGTPLYGLAINIGKFTANDPVLLKANVKNDLVLVKSTASDSNVGGIVGANNKGSVSYSVNASKVECGSNSNSAGGIIGSHGDGLKGNLANLEYSYNSGHVSGEMYRKGGCVGIINGNGSAKACYNTAVVEDRYGGFLGRFDSGGFFVKNGTVESCYTLYGKFCVTFNFGSNVKNCFYIDRFIFDDGVIGTRPISEGDLKKYNFPRGTLITSNSPTGIFEYPYPYIAGPDGLNLIFHRTPWK